jgi:AcrR family transcriptional regulator
MNTGVEKQKRAYKSSLRDRQAGETRSRILEAFSAQIVDSGLKDFSIEQVAQRAGVSARTIYHHFPNRDELFDAVTSWVHEQATGENLADAATLDEFTGQIGKVFQSFDQHESMVRAQLVTELGQTVRRRARSQRRLVIESLVRSEAPGLPDAEVKNASALIHYLSSSEAWRSMKDESGLSGDEAGKTVVWAIRTLVDRLKSMGNRPKR